MTRKKKIKHIENKSKLKNLKVNDGVDQPSSINLEAINRYKSQRKKGLVLKDYVNGILNKDITILSKAITLVESSLEQHYDLAQEIIERCLPYSGNSIRIGITGVPGVGKSTFIESLGMYITKKNNKLAVLAIDPSSKQYKGSILGDKTRMERLSANPNAFIRPSPTAGSLGGVARKTRETIILCEAAGFDTVFVETVGVGQSEVAVHSMVDFFLLLMLAGAGDELQGIKRGIMEMADAIAISKADGANTEKAEAARIEYANALHLFPMSKSEWTPKVVTCSATENTGIENIWKIINDYFILTKKNTFFFTKRREQSKYWMYESINETVKNHFYSHSIIKKELEKIEDDVLNNKINSFTAAKKLLNLYFK